MKLNFKDGKGDKVHISIDGEYRFTVDKTYFLGLFLSQGQEIDENELLCLSENIENRRAFNQAVSYLSRRDHSERELLLKLRQKGYAESGENAVTKLKDGGYLDDGRFARVYVRELKDVKKFGRKRIEQELFRKGISRDIIREVLEETEFDESGIYDIIRRKYLRHLSDEKGRKRTVNALLRMGYSYGEIKEAFNNLSAEDENEVEYE